MSSMGYQLPMNHLSIESHGKLHRIDIKTEV